MGDRGGAHSSLRILSPKAGELLKQDFVTVKYDLSNNGIAGGSPNYRVRLDGREPVVTTFADYTFTGLKPGEHTLTVELVDANNTPVPNTSAEVRFNSANAGASPQPAPSGPATSPPQVRQTSFRPASDDGLPKSGSALPLLSVIGFGVLVGGIASTLKTR